VIYFLVSSTNAIQNGCSQSPNQHRVRKAPAGEGPREAKVPQGCHCFLTSSRLGGTTEHKACLVGSRDNGVDILSSRKPLSSGAQDFELLFSDRDFRRRRSSYESVQTPAKRCAICVTSLSAYVFFRCHTTSRLPFSVTTVV
jgi:hypothetical protein